MHKLRFHLLIFSICPFLAPGIAFYLWFKIVLPPFSTPEALEDKLHEYIEGSCVWLGDLFSISHLKTLRTFYILNTHRMERTAEEKPRSPIWAAIHFKLGTTIYTNLPLEIGEKSRKQSFTYTVVQCRHYLYNKHDIWLTTVLPNDCYQKRFTIFTL